MTHPTEALTDDLARALRAGLQVAMLAGQDIARRRENRLRQAQQDSAQRAAALTARLRAERASAEAQLRPVHSPRWWTASTPEILANTYRTAYAWKDQSALAADTLTRLDEQLAQRHGIDTNKLGVDPAAVADKVEAVMNERIAREKASEPFTERGFTVVEDRPAGRGFIPTWDLRQASGENVDRETIDAAPAHWAVYLARDKEAGGWTPEYFCTDPDAAGLNRPIPPLYLAYEDWWWEMAAEHQIAEIHDQFVHNGSAYGIAHMQDQISRRYGIDARPFAGLPDDLAARISSVNDERDKERADDKGTRERVDAAAAIAQADAIDKSADRRQTTEATAHSAQEPAPSPREQQDFAHALEWAKQAVPRDAERYVDTVGRRQDAARETIITGWEVAQSKGWAADHAPALAAQFAQSEASANREDYLTARTELIGEWTTAGRPHVDVISALAPPAVPFKYDSKERRDALTATLTAAGVDPDAIAARLAADRDNAHPIGAPVAGASSSPKARKGDRSAGVEVSTEKGDR